MQAGTVEILLQMKDDFSSALKGLNEGLRGAAKEAKSTSGAFGDLTGSVRQLVGMAAAYVSVSKLTSLTKEAGMAAIEAENSELRLALAIKNRADAASLSASSLSEMAGSLSELSGVSDESIREAEAVLLRFKSVTAKNIGEVTEVLVDFAAMARMDVTTAARLLGRALESPGESMMALNRAGITLSDTEKKLIKDLKDAGQAAAAQAQFMDILKEKTVGYAQEGIAPAQLWMNRLKNSWGEFLEAVGQQGMLDKLIVILKKLNEYLRSDAAMQFAREIGGAITKAVAFFGEKMAWAVNHVELLVKALKAFITMKAVAAFASMGDSVLAMVAPLTATAGGMQGATGAINAFGQEASHTTMILDGLGKPFQLVGTQATKVQAGLANAGKSAVKMNTDFGKLVGPAGALLVATVGFNNLTNSQSEFVRISGTVLNALGLLIAFAPLLPTLGAAIKALSMELLAFFASGPGLTLLAVVGVAEALNRWAKWSAKRSTDAMDDMSEAVASFGATIQRANTEIGEGFLDWDTVNVVKEKMAAIKIALASTTDPDKINELNYEFSLLLKTLEKLEKIKLVAIKPPEPDAPEAEKNPIAEAVAAFQLSLTEQEKVQKFLQATLKETEYSLQGVGVSLEEVSKRYSLAQERAAAFAQVLALKIDPLSGTGKDLMDRILALNAAKRAQEELNAAIQNGNEMYLSTLPALERLNLTFEAEKKAITAWGVATGATAAQVQQSMDGATQRMQDGITALSEQRGDFEKQHRDILLAFAVEMKIAEEWARTSGKSTEEVEAVMSAMRAKVEKELAKVDKAIADSKLLGVEMPPVVIEVDAAALKEATELADAFGASMGLTTKEMVKHYNLWLQMNAATKAYKDELKRIDTLKVSQAVKDAMALAAQLKLNGAQAAQLDTSEQQLAAMDRWIQGAQLLSGILGSMNSKLADALNMVIGIAGAYQQMAAAAAAAAAAQEAAAAAGGGNTALNASASEASSASKMASASLYVAIVMMVVGIFKSIEASKKARRYSSTAVVGMDDGSLGSQSGGHSDKDLDRGVAEAILGLLDTFQSITGTFITGIETMTIDIREDGKYFKAYLEGAFLGQFETETEAIAAVVAAGLTSGEFTGTISTAMREMLQAVNDNTKGWGSITQGITSEQLQEQMAFIQQIEDEASGIDATTKALQGLLAQIQNVEAKLLEFGVSAKEAFRLAGEWGLAQANDIWNSLTGKKKSAKEELALLKMKGEMLIMQLKLWKLEIEGKMEFLKAEGKMLEEEYQMYAGFAARLGIFIDSLHLEDIHLPGTGGGSGSAGTGDPPPGGGGFGDHVNRFAEAVKSFKDAQEQLRKAIHDLKYGESTTALTDRERLKMAFADYQKNLALAKGGNLQAVQALPEMLNRVLELAKSWTGGGEMGMFGFESFTQFFDEMLREGSAIADMKTPATITDGNTIYHKRVAEASEAHHTSTKRFAEQNRQQMAKQAEIGETQVKVTKQVVDKLDILTKTAWRAA